MNTCMHTCSLACTHACYTHQKKRPFLFIPNISFYSKIYSNQNSGASDEVQRLREALLGEAGALLGRSLAVSPALWGVKWCSRQREQKAHSLQHHDPKSCYRTSPGWAAQTWIFSEPRSGKCRQGRKWMRSHWSHIRDTKSPVSVCILLLFQVDPPYKGWPCLRRASPQLCFIILPTTEKLTEHHHRNPKWAFVQKHRAVANTFGTHRWRILSSHVQEISCVSDGRRGRLL